MNTHVLAPSIQMIRPRPVRRRLLTPLLAIFAIGALIVLAPVVLTLAPDEIDLGARLQPPIGLGGTWSHPLGTDQLGRDVFDRILVGARVSLAIGIAATVLAGTVGSGIGLTGGYLGHLTERITLWFGDVQMALPFVVIAIGISAVLRPSLPGVILILGFSGWATYARVARLTAQPLRHAMFIDAARVNGATETRVIFRHLLPVAMSPILAIASQQAGAMILYESALSFLGIGVPASTITWGRMIADARDLPPSAWWVTVMPGLAIVFTVLAFNIVGIVLHQRLLGRRSWSV